MFLTHLFNLFSTSKWFVLFWVTLLLRFDNIASKSVFAIKMACAILTLKTSAANLLDSWVSICLSWLWLLTLFSIYVVLVL